MFCNVSINRFVPGKSTREIDKICTQNTIVGTLIVQTYSQKLIENTILIK